MSATRFRRGYDLRLFLQRGVATSYAYRADGMRVKKVLPGGDVTRSYYDGQMPVEEDSVVSGTSSVTRNFVGARGIESIFTTTTSGTTTAFPLYDCHGNMVATVARNGAGFTTSNIRTYDVWGGVRTGATTGGPKGRYVANLGHVQDDESGLIYMRARYYEPESGRFISEDPARDGSNWFAYCSNDSVNRIDREGTRDYPEWFTLTTQAIGGLMFVSGEILMTCALVSVYYAVTPQQITGAVSLAATGIALAALGFAGMVAPSSQDGIASFYLSMLGLVIGSILKKFSATLLQMTTAAAVGSKTLASAAVMACFAYSLMLFAVLESSEWD